MSNYFRMIKEGEKLPKVTPDKIDRDYLRKSKAEYEEYLKKNNAEIEREKD